jgi:hypothetical protein
VGAQRELSRYDSGDPLLAWGQDAVAATGPGCTVVTGGFERFFLLRLLDRPWPAPYTDTWAYARSLGTAGPQAFDAGDLTVDNVERRLSEGGRVFVLDTAYELLAADPLRSASRAPSSSASTSRRWSTAPSRPSRSRARPFREPLPRLQELQAVPEGVEGVEARPAGVHRRVARGLERGARGRQVSDQERRVCLPGRHEGGLGWHEAHRFRARSAPTLPSAASRFAPPSAGD